MAGLSKDDYANYLNIAYMVNTIGHESTLQCIYKMKVLLRVKRKKKSVSCLYKSYCKYVDKLYTEIYYNHLIGNCVSVACFIFEKLLMAGYEPTICIGVNDFDMHVNAHMWVECDGVVFDTFENKNKYSKIINITVDSLFSDWMGTML